MNLCIHKCDYNVKTKDFRKLTDLITSDERGSVKLVERTVVKDFYEITQASVSIRMRRIKVLYKNYSPILHY